MSDPATEEATLVISALLPEIDRYLGTFDMPGVREVRRGLELWSSGDYRPVQPLALPACDFLPVALSSMVDRKLAAAIAKAIPMLHWVTYDAYARKEIGEAFADGHAFASLIGDGGFYHADDFDLGLFVIAPDIVYRDRRHAAPELYAPLTGPHLWRFLPDRHYHTIAADIPVWNEPWAPHATHTGSVPFLCIYCWTKDVNRPAEVITTGEAQNSPRI